MVDIEFASDWEHVVAQAALPALRQMAQDAREYIGLPPGPHGTDVGGAPVGYGADPHIGQLRDLSFAEVDEETGDVLLGVYPAASYAHYVIFGTSSQAPNHYLNRALEHALQQQRGSQPSSE